MRLTAFSGIGRGLGARARHCGRVLVLGVGIGLLGYTSLYAPNHAGQIRYHVDLSQPDTWIETGEYSRDGTQWLPTIRMELKKVR